MADSITDIFSDGRKLFVSYFSGREEVFDVHVSALGDAPEGDYCVSLNGGAPISFFNVFRRNDIHTKFYKFRPEETFLLVRSLKAGRPVRFYEGLSLDDLAVLALDIEVANRFGFPRVERPEDCILAVSLAYSPRGGRDVETRVLLSGGLSEEAERLLLEEFWGVLSALRPDVLVGHNIYGFDLPFLIGRSQRLGVRIPFLFQTQKGFKRLAERVLRFERVRMKGFQIMDTMILAAMYDTYARAFSSYGLKEVAKDLGLSVEGRPRIDVEHTMDVFLTDRETFKAYVQADAVEAFRLFYYLSPPFFEITKFTPKTFEDVVLSGSGQLFDYYLVTQHIERRQSLNVPKPHVQQRQGGLVAAFGRGVFRKGEWRIYHVDVESLYPSIMLTFGIVPDTDAHGFFYETLRTFTARRLELKRAGRKAESDALKIFINSAYGVLSASSCWFRDSAKGERVAALGREVLSSMIEEARALGYKPLICDTDGLIFAVPASVEPNEATAALQGVLKRRFGDGLRLSFEAEYDALAIYKKKNYAALVSGVMKVRGATLKSRRLERIFRDLIFTSLRLSMEGRFEDVWEEVARVRRRLLQRDVSAEDIAAYVSLNEVSSSADLPQRRLWKERERLGLPVFVGQKVGYYVSGTQKKKSFRVADFVRPIEVFSKDDYSIAFYVLRRLPEIEEIIRAFSKPMEELP